LMATRGETTPLSMTMMGGPIDARKSPTSVNNLATTKGYEWFENNVIYRVPANFPGAGRRVYPGFLQHTGFVAMNPDRHAKSHYDYFKDLIKGDDASVDAHRKFYDEYNAVLDMDADYYLETISTVFQDFKLVNGTWDVKNPQGKLERVRPQDIQSSAVLTVEGELDDISGSGQTQAAHGLCSGVPAAKHQHLEAEGAGHFAGRRWRDVVYPVVKQFILDNEAKAAPAVKPVDVAMAAPVVVKAAVVKPDVKTAVKPVVQAVVAAPATAKKVSKKTIPNMPEVAVKSVEKAVATPVAVPAPAVALAVAPVVAATPVVTVVPVVATAPITAAKPAAKKPAAKK
jgi:poly(3-hydroxybutyrate) depolymerase